LSNDEGQSLFSGPLAALRAPLAQFFEPEVQAITWSAHLDHGLYMELVLHGTVDLPADDLAHRFLERLDATRAEASRYVASLPDHPYWRPVRVQFDNMLAEWLRQTRVAREGDAVIANVWLPEIAAHNLVAAGELALSAARGGAPAAAASDPLTLDQLLATRRDISIVGQPDLIHAIADLQREVSGEFPRLPFVFEVRLLGADLAEQGITQNQRLAPLELRDATLAEILTAMVVSANPDKNATGPSDPRCRLVWIVGEDPNQPGRPIVMVTTRQAAANRGLTLPPPFQTVGD
jgi:hypothetical protein